VPGDKLDRPSLDAALKGVHTAYGLVHLRITGVRNRSVVVEAGEFEPLRQVIRV